MDVTSSYLGLFAIIPILIYLGLLIFSIYFVVKVIRFINAKTKLDEQRNEKLDELIRVMGKKKQE